MIRVLVCWLFCSATVALAEAPSPAVTGFQTKDRSVTIDRCVKTSWSFSGCTAVFPQQARASLAASCADPKTEYRNVLCEHFARLQLRGVGGPVDRKAALATLSALCAQKDRVACADLALLYGWKDEAEGRKYLAAGCEEDPNKSPVGLCSTLEHVLQPATRRRAFTVASSSFAEVKKGSQCQLGVAPESPEGATECFVRLTCGDRVLYDGQAPCTCAGSGGEMMTSGEDGDPALTFDAASGAVELREEASATAPAWTITGKLKR